MASWSYKNSQEYKKYFSEPKIFLIDENVRRESSQLPPSFSQNTPLNFFLIPNLKNYFWKYFFLQFSGNKFCVLVGSTKITPLIYRYDKGKPAPQLLSKIESGTNLNSISWAPQGGWLIVYGASTPGGLVYFIDASGATEANRIRSIEHPSLTKVCFLFVVFWGSRGEGGGCLIFY